VKALEHHVLLRKVTAVSGVLEPVPGYRFLRILGFAALNISESVIDPRFQKVETFTNYHVIIIRYGQQRIPVCEDRVERLTYLPYFEGNRISTHSKVKVPIEVEVIVKVVTHKRLIGELLIEKPVTVRYLGIEVDDALAIAEQVDV
jgi:hypothetical protein